MPPSPMPKTVAALVQDTNDISLTDAEGTMEGLDLRPTALKPPASVRSVLAN